MKKLLLTLVACAVAIVANAQLYVTGINGNWTMPAPMTVQLNSAGNYEFTTSTEFKMSTTNGSNWDNDFNPNALLPATALNSALQTQTVALKKDGGNNFSLPYGNGAVEFTITVSGDFSKVTVTGATPPVAGDYTKLYLCGTNSSWGFTEAWMFTTTDGNLYYMEGKTLTNNAEFKVAGNGWSPNYGDAGNVTINTETTLVKGSNPANLKLATGGSNLTISFNMTTNAFLISNEGKKVGDSTEKNPYENLWVNCRGDFNDWQDNGIHPNTEGIATFTALPIGTTEFEIKCYETEDVYYGTDTPVTPGTWIELTKDGGHMTIAGARENAAYDVQFNVTNNEIMLTPVNVTYPENMYILGEVNGNGWAADQGVLMTNKGDGIYTADDIELTGIDAGYFSFSEVLGANADDWDSLVRYGSAGNGDTEVVLGQPMPIASGEVAFYAPNGTYNLEMNFATMNITLTAVEEEEPPTLDPVEATYNFESFDNCVLYYKDLPAESTWTADGSNKYFVIPSGSVLTGEKGTTITVEYPAGTAGASATRFYSYSGKYDLRMNKDNVLTLSAPNGSVITKVVFNCSSTNTQINKMTCLSEGNFVNNSSAKTMTWTPADARAMSNVNSLQFSATGAVRIGSIEVSADMPTGIESVEAVEGEVVFYNLQGQKVANPDKGIYIKVAGGKASKVIL